MRKGLFIGLGGSGVSTVAYIKANLLKYYNNDEVLLNQNNSFYCIDTDTRTLDMINGTPGLKNIIKEQSEFKSLGDANPYQIYMDVAHLGNKEKVKTFNEWAYKPETWDNVVLDKGAKADRQLGRSALFTNTDSILAGLSGKIANLTTIVGFEELINTKRQELITKGKAAENVEKSAVEEAINDTAPLIWVYSSSCGGTGSSLLLDMLYYIDRIYQRDFPILGDAYVKLFLYMPRPFIKKNPGNLRYPLNPIAIFNELNEMFYDHQVLGKKIFESVKVTTIDAMYHNNRKISPFTYIIPIDSLIGTQNITIDNLPEVTAKISTYLHLGNAAGKVLSEFDNFIKNIYKNQDLQSNDNGNNITWYPYLAGAGFRCIIKSNKEFIEYVGKRLKYEILEYGFLGSEFNQVHPTEKTQKEVAIDFTVKSIFKYINLSNRVNGVPNIDVDYKKIIHDILGIDNETIVISDDQKKNLDVFKSNFINDVKTEVGNLDNKYWRRKESDNCKVNYANKIMEDVRLNAENTILSYGFRYTHELIRRVDDNECTILYNDLIKNRENYTPEAIQEREGAINTKTKVKEISNYQNACVEYANLLIGQKINEFKIELLSDLIETRKGLLEKFRNTESGMKGGLQGYLNISTALCNHAKSSYCELAKTFKLTDNDIATSYVPSLVLMAASDNSWKTDNYFSQNYSNSIVSHLETSEINTLGDHLPLRINTEENNKAIENIMRQLWNQVISQNENYYFCKKDNLENKNDQSAVLTTFLEKLTDIFIKNALIGTNTAAAQFLDKSLEIYLSQNTDYIPTLQAIMKSQTNIMYNRTQSPGQQARSLYVGQSKAFAAKFGYIDGSNESDHISNDTENNMFYKIILEPGYTFQHYSEYETIAKIYANHRKVGFKEYFPHLHKGLKDASMEEIAKRKLLESAGESDIDALTTELKDILLLFWFEAIRQQLVEKDKECYKKIFKTTIATLGRKSNGSTDDNLLSDGALIKLEIPSKVSSVLNVKTKIFMDFGLIKMDNNEKYLINCPKSSAVELMVNILNKFSQSAIVKGQLLTEIGKIRDENKQILKSLIETDQEKISEKFISIFTDLLEKNNFISVKTDDSFINSLLVKLDDVNGEILTVLS